MNTNYYDLRPIHDNHKSFYGKAKIHTFSDDQEYTLQLISYSTLVCNITRNDKGTKIEVFGTYSPTTLRHIKEFLTQNKIPYVNKSQIERDYCIEGGVYV